MATKLLVQTKSCSRLFLRKKKPMNFSVRVKSPQLTRKENPYVSSTTVEKVLYTAYFKAHS